MKNGKWKMENVLTIFSLALALCAGAFAQTGEPKPAAPKSVKIPAVKETKLKNGLTVAVVERKNVPLVTVQLLLKAGSLNEDLEIAGAADITASLLTKGTKTRSATQIAEQMEFLGGSLNSGANWNSSFVSVNVMSDKLDQALAIMADTVINPSFKEEEVELLQSQTLDGLTYNLNQPGFLANYVASVYSFDEHPTGGTPESINALKRDHFVRFYKTFYKPENAVLIFTGDITPSKANELAGKYFGSWTNENETERKEIIEEINESPGTLPAGSEAKTEQKPVVNKILVIDLPNSGQAAVSYAKSLDSGRIDYDDNGITSGSHYYPAIVLNSLLGGGYSSRLNQEIRIKRGLSYGAGSSFAWRDLNSNFGTRTQTKNETAAEVAELVVGEIRKLSEGEIPETELNPRRLVLTGGFGRSLETNQGLANALADLYAFELPADGLNSYMNNVMSVTDKQIKQFAAESFSGGDIIIVGDYAIFKDDLKKRFPNVAIDVVKADELDITKENLRKAGK